MRLHILHHVEVVADPGLDSDDVLGLAASVDQFSAHVLAHAVTLKARRRGTRVTLPGNVTEVYDGGARLRRRRST